MIVSTLNRHLFRQIKNNQRWVPNSSRRSLHGNMDRENTQNEDKGFPEYIDIKKLDVKLSTVSMKVSRP